MRLSRGNTALLAIDIQERLFSHVQRGVHVLAMMRKALEGLQILKVPVLATAQVPEKMGSVLPQILHCLHKEQQILEKSSFSCLGDAGINAFLESMSEEQWILIGIETHICVLQTAKDLIAAGKQVVILSNAVTARHEEDHLLALEELRDIGVRISTVETILFELLRGAAAPEFRQIRDLVK